jgi:hypothetical protein
MDSTGKVATIELFTSDKRTFPAVHALFQRVPFDMPVAGVAKPT